LKARVAQLEGALSRVRDWIRHGIGSESDAAEAMDAALDAVRPADTKEEA
jgi:hypothetical protein